MPPRPTACSWWVSPINTSRHSATVGEVGEGVEVAGVEHAGLVHDHRGPRRQTPPRVWSPVGAGPFVDEFGDGVGVDAGFGFQLAGCFRRRCQPEHAAALHREALGGGGEHFGLARPGGSEDQHEPIVAGDQRRRLRVASHPTGPPAPG